MRSLTTGYTMCIQSYIRLLNDTKITRAGGHFWSMAFPQRFNPMFWQANS